MTKLAVAVQKALSMVCSKVDTLATRVLCRTRAINRKASAVTHSSLQEAKPQSSCVDQTHTSCLSLCCCVYAVENGGLNYLAILDTAADVAKAMLHLHSLNVLHSDL